jgi:hypothetical protein
MSSVFRTFLYEGLKVMIEGKGKSFELHEKGMNTFFGFGHVSFLLCKVLVKILDLG